MTLFNSKYVYMYIKVYENDICSLFVNWNPTKQKHVVGPFSNIFLGQCRISAVITKVVIFTPMSHLHQAAPLAIEDGLKWSYTSVGTSSHSAPVFPVQSSAWWTDCRPAKDFRNWEFRLVKAALMLWDVSPLFGGAWRGVGKQCPRYCLFSGLVWYCTLGKGWQKKDTKIQLWWGPAEQTLGFCFVCFGTVSAKLVLHSRSQSFREKCTSTTPPGTADFECVCLPLWGMWTQAAWVHIMHGEWRSWELSALLYSQQEFCPLAAPAPAGCWFCTLALCKLNFDSSPGQTADSFSWDSKQTTSLGPALFSSDRWSPLPFPIHTSPCRNRAEQGCQEAGTELLYVEQYEPW